MLFRNSQMFFEKRHKILKALWRPLSFKNDVRDYNFYGESIESFRNVPWLVTSSRSLGTLRSYIINRPPEASTNRSDNFA